MERVMRYGPILEQKEVVMECLRQNRRLLEWCEKVCRESSIVKEVKGRISS